jgi:transposase
LFGSLSPPLQSGKGYQLQVIHYLHSVITKLTVRSNFDEISKLEYTPSMKETLNIETERVDDIPLLLAHMQGMNLASLLDKHIPVHGNRKGLSLGNVTMVWLSHILSEANHRMNHVQEWAVRRLEVVRSCGLNTFEAGDVTDDRLADILHALSNDIYWSAFEQELMENLVRVYDMQKECVRIDTTTVSSYAEVDEQGLLQFGHSKDHRPDLAQLKLVLASLDPLGMPLATEVLSGEHADDPLYLPIITRVREGLKKEGLLYVGDCKMAALQTRVSIQFHRDFYLCPLSSVQVPLDQLQREVDKLKNKAIHVISVERVNDKNERVCIAQGYDTSQELTAKVDGQLQTWTERRLLIQSTGVAKAAMHSLLERVNKAEHAIQHLLIRKQGKPHLKTRAEIDEAIQEVMKKFRVEGFLDVTVHEEKLEHPTRAYRGKVSPPRQEVLFTISSERREQDLEYAISHLGWRVYATNQKTEDLPLERAVEAYRDEYLIERCFERLKGHPFSLAPLYVQRDDHRVGLVRLLTIALRVLTLLEGVVRQNLQKQKGEIVGLYAGNPKRRTNQPTAERLLEAFSEVTLTIVHTSSFVQRHVTQLSSLQKQILSLLGFTPAIYLQLADDS